MISPQFFLVLLFLSYTHAIILDAVPSSCTSACRPVASSLENCQYLTCICDEQHGRDFQSCLTCIYRLLPNNETYAAAQGTLQSFQSNCKDKLAVVLNITAISSSTSGTSSSTPIPSSSSSRSSNSTSISASTSNAPPSSASTSRANSTISGSQTPIPTVSSNSTTTALPSSSSTILSSTSTKSSSSVRPTTTGPPIKLGDQQQICRLRSDYPSRRVRLSYARSVEEKKPVAKPRAVFAFLAVLVFIPIGVLVVRT